MFAWLGDLLRFLRGVVVRERRPRELALGLAIGVVIGLVPKANLTAMGLVGLLFVTRANIMAALMSAVVFTWIGLAADPVLHHFGKAVLSILPLQGFYSRLFALPYAPWTAFNNTVVMGAIFLGALQFYPTYRLAKRYFERRLGAHEDWRVRPSDVASDLTGDSDSLTRAWRIG